MVPYFFKKIVRPLGHCKIDESAKRKLLAEKNRKEERWQRMKTRAN